ncbi:MAG: metallophosphoesterase family protein [Hyphomicrobiaceae bacterium]
MSDTTIAHVSDLHLGPIPPLRLVDWNVKRGLGLLNWHRKRKRLHSAEAWGTVLADLTAHRPDHIALTGDLVNVGLPAEHAAAAQWLATLGRPEDVTVIPGNHDIYTRLWRDAGIARWQPYMSGDGGENGPVDGFPFLRRRGDLAIVALNSAEPTPPFVASGQVGARQIAAARDLLDAARRQGLFRCVLIHHPPLPGQARRGRNLRDAAALAAMLRAVGVEMVLHGHNHRDMVATFETASGRALVCGIASGSMALAGHGDGARYGLHAIRRTAGGWRIDSGLRGLDGSGGVGPLGRSVVELARHG